MGCGLCFLGTATYARFLDIVPGVAVENIVANVSALDLNKNNLITALNVTHAIEENGPQINANLFMGLNETDYEDAEKTTLSNTIEMHKINFHNDFPAVAYRTKRDDEFNQTQNNIYYYTNGSNNDFNYDFNTTTDYLDFLDSNVDLSDVSVNYTDYDNQFTEVQNITHDLSEKQNEVLEIQAIPDEIVLQIPKVDENKFLWLPLTLLLLSALFAHMGIKLIPWMLIGEVCC